MVAGQKRQISRRVRSNVQQDVVGVGLELPGPGEACLASHPLPAASAVSVQADRAVGLNELR